MFSIPAIYFYAHLGTSPSEVGYTYTSVLSGSVLGTIAVLGALLVIGYYAIFLFLIIAANFLWLVALGWIVSHPSLRGKDQDLDSDQFERKLKVAKRIYLRKDVPWSDVERQLRRRRELGRLEKPTAAETSELKEIKKKVNYGNVVYSPINAIMYKLRPVARISLLLPFLSS